MIIVVFEGILQEGKMHDYQERASQYQEKLQEIAGLISNDRYQSSDPAKVLSVSVWKDEESIRAFRQLEMHVDDEAAGRSGLFKDYRIRITKLLRDYGLNNRHDAP